MKSRSLKFKALQAAEIMKVPNKEFDANAETLLLKDNDSQNTIDVPTSTYICDTENQIVRPTTSSMAILVSVRRKVLRNENKKCENLFNCMKVIIHTINQVTN